MVLMVNGLTLFGLRFPVSGLRLLILTGRGPELFILFLGFPINSLDSFLLLEINE